jgi:FkbM family methyltransferase
MITKAKLLLCRLVSGLPVGSFSRSLAKRIFKGLTIKQPYHNGIICLDAVGHAWGWLGSQEFEKQEIGLQEKLLSLSYRHELMVDIGSNIGQMSLTVLLRNPNINAVCVEPNHRNVSLFKKSLRLNRLTERVTILEAMVSDKDGVGFFDDSSSPCGHVVGSGKKVKSIDFVSLLNKYSVDAKCLVKIDIEGFEHTLMELLSGLKHLNNLCMVIELHPYGFCQFGNPGHCLKMLVESGARILDLSDAIVTQVPRDAITQVIASWPRA